MATLLEHASPTAPRADEVLNSGCVCTSLDPQALEQALEQELGEQQLLTLIKERCPHLFSAQPIFVSAVHLERMRRVIHAAESVVALPAYREEVLSRAPSIARVDPSGARGVFLGYDFHIAQNKLGLIEINTNAGGILMNAVLARAQRACCSGMESFVPSSASITALEDQIVAMFRNEWGLSGHAAPLHTIAIVDENPQQQYLYAEFLLFKRLFERHGLTVIIADPTELSLRDGRLWHEQVPLDLVYNRLTDFALEARANVVLRNAYLQGAVVLTPHPQAHALYADKRNLALLSSEEHLTALGVAPDIRRVLLDHIPRTEIVDAAHAERLWRERRGLFFKPAAGFGSRAAYRGDKLTQRVWHEILSGCYVAQEFIAPGERIVGNVAKGEDTSSNNLTTSLLKFDVRNYVYDSRVQWVAARLYQGQTTNFRTAGGGFAPVYATAGGDRTSA